MNEFIRSILIKNIKNAIEEYKIAKKIEHPFLVGKLREIVLDNLIQPLLNSRYSTASGKILDYRGTLSTEIDIYIYSNNLHPSFFFQKQGQIAVTPLESILKCIEVKSQFSPKELKTTFEKFKFIDQELQMTPGIHNSDGLPLSHHYIKPKYDFFAFNSDIKKYSPEYILSVYKDIDLNWDSDPLISSICIANKGWACFSPRGWFHRSKDSRTKINEEMIGYLCTLIQDLPNVENSRGSPRIGYYLFDSYQMDKIVGGKKIKNTWKNKSIAFTDERSTL